MRRWGCRIVLGMGLAACAALAGCRSLPPRAAPLEPYRPELDSRSLASAAQPDPAARVPDAAPIQPDAEEPAIRTLLPGDRLFVNKAVFGPEIPGLGWHLPAWRQPRRGEVIVFDSVEDDLKLVKRLIGVPGDTLEMQGGELYVNGLRQAEPWARHTDRGKGEFAEARRQMRGWTSYLDRTATAS